MPLTLSHMIGFFIPPFVFEAFSFCLIWLAPSGLISHVFLSSCDGGTFCLTLLIDLILIHMIPSFEEGLVQLLPL